VAVPDVEERRVPASGVPGPATAGMLWQLMWGAMPWLSRKPFRSLPSSLWYGQ